MTDGLPALALVLKPPDSDILTRPPRPVDEPMVDRRGWSVVAVTGMALAATTFAVFAWTLPRGGVQLARALTFTTLALGHTAMSLAFRNPAKTFWQLGLFTNRWLLLVITGSGLVQVLIVASPTGQRLFQLTDVPWHATAAGALLSLIPLIVLEALKLLRSRGNGQALGAQRDEGAD